MATQKNFKKSKGSTTQKKSTPSAKISIKNKSFSKLAVKNPNKNSSSKMNSSLKNKNANPNLTPPKPKLKPNLDLVKKTAVAKKEKPKTDEEARTVKKDSYSKALRAAVLADAAVRQKLIETGGENTISIIRDFDKDMSDEELARKTGIKASDVRVVLNRLHNIGLFFYTRLRDRDSGWYSYIWKMKEDKLKEFSDGIMEGGVGETTRIVKEDCYRCLACSPEKMVNFEEAMDDQFRCTSCGSMLEFSEKKK